jgi:flagellin-like protein
MKRKGLSPVVATVLLISIAVVLAVIVLFWARGFISEKIQKSDEPVENSCESLVFGAEIDSNDNELVVINRGNVPIYGISVKEEGIGFVSISGTVDKDVTLGDSVVFGGGEIAPGFTFVLDEEYIIVPRILGETKDAKVPHSCDDDFGLKVKAT